MSLVNEYLKTIKRATGRRIMAIALSPWEAYDGFTIDDGRRTGNKRMHSRTYKIKHRNKKKYSRQRAHMLYVFCASSSLPNRRKSYIIRSIKYREITSAIERSPNGTINIYCF